MRGKGTQIKTIATNMRITPAHAGKRNGQSRAWQTTWDHPRACGEKVMSSDPTFPSLGSPPRMRGKVLSKNLEWLRTRITPAHAGKSWPSSLAAASAWDHPRACGEKMDATQQITSNAGSPPRMRGKAKEIGERAWMKWDHPRACGEKQNAVTCLLAAMGSPPRMRGKVSHPESCSGRLGITPAHAGKSSFSKSLSRSDRDHPRACGEKTRPAM